MPTSIIFSDVTLRLPELAIAFAGGAILVGGVAWCLSRLERFPLLSHSTTPPGAAVLLPLVRSADGSGSRDMEERLGTRLSPKERKYFSAFEKRTGQKLYSEQPALEEQQEQKRWMFLRYLIQKGVYSDNETNETNDT